MKKFSGGYMVPKQGEGAVPAWGVGVGLARSCGGLGPC